MAILPKLVGARIKRREDPALIQGLGQYVDDIPMAGTLHATFLRSPYARARIKTPVAASGANSASINPIAQPHVVWPEG